MPKLQPDFAETRVTVCMSDEMKTYLKAKAKREGMESMSVLLRYVIVQMMNDEGLPHA